MLQSYLSSSTAIILSVGILVGVAASLLGSFLVLQRNSMLTDAVSHSILLGIVLVALLSGSLHSPWQLLGAVLAGLATVALSTALTQSRLVNQDAAIGLIFPLLFAVAVLLINVYARNVHLDVDAVLLGEIALSWLDTYRIGGYDVPRALLLMAAVTLINGLFVLLFYKELKLSIFDPALARLLGFRPQLLTYALLSLMSITAVSAFEAVGAVLFVAFVIVPASAAYLLTDRLWRMLLYSVGIAAASSLSGFALALRWNVSIGGMMASMTGALFAVALLASPRYGLISQAWRYWQQRYSNAERILLIHLYHHEHSRSQAEENCLDALQSHLRWSRPRAQAVLERSLSKGLVHKQQGQLQLSERGRQQAQEVLEPTGNAVSKPRKLAS